MYANFSKNIKNTKNIFLNKLLLIYIKYKNQVDKY